MLFISNEANDDEYSAKTNAKPNNVDDYWRYYEMDYDDWLGKMRERTSALYKIVAGIGRMEMSDANAALHYAVMDLNKRGGGSDVKSSAPPRRWASDRRAAAGEGLLTSFLAFWAWGTAIPPKLRGETEPVPPDSPDLQ